MRRMIFILIAALMLVGCTPSEEQIAAERDEEIANRWAAGGNEGPPPDVDAQSVRQVIGSATAVADRVILYGSTDDDCDAFGNYFDTIALAEFDDERNDYLAPLANAISQIDSGCRVRGTWEGTIDDVATVSELGNEYLARF